jgi:hypothetical protein
MTSTLPDAALPAPSGLSAATSLLIACSLTDAEMRGREQEVTTLFDRIVQVRSLPDGYAFAFPPEDRNIRDVLDLVLAERACCPFLTFELVFPAPHETVWLHLRGSEEVKEFVRGSFLLRVPTGVVRE